MRTVVLCDLQVNNDGDLPTLLPRTYLAPVRLRSSDGGRARLPNLSNSLVPPHCCPRHPWPRGLVPLAAAPAVNGFCCHPMAERGTHAVDGICIPFKDKGAGV